MKYELRVYFDAADFLRDRDRIDRLQRRILFALGSMGTTNVIHMSLQTVGDRMLAHVNGEPWTLEEFGFPEGGDAE